MPREPKKRKRERVQAVIPLLKRTYPEAECALNHDGPLQLLVATILSAQCTDERVNKVTPGLFEKYRTAGDFAEADPEELQQEIRSTGFFRNKTKSLIESCKAIVERHDRKVPDTMAELTALPGVARKTASVVLGVAYGKAEGIVVDTHVARLSIRLKLTSAKKANTARIEKDLMELVPEEEWIDWSHLLIFHGRNICTARKPDCGACPMAEHCPSAGKV